ncbi:MAG: LptA/OstA family protein [Qingshengfaniella sp.]
MIRRIVSHIAAGAAVALFAASATLAQTGIQTGGLRADPNAPVAVEADDLALDQTAGTAVFRGNVSVIQGEMTLTAPEITVHYLHNPDGSLSGDIDRITASGGVMIVTPTEAAEARDAIYTPASSEMVMTGDVVLTQGGNTLAGERLTVDLETGTGRVEGRVRTILQPGNQPQ